jgi:hypothetical protein
VQPLAGRQGGGRCQERVLLPSVDGRRQHRPGRLAQHELLRHPPDLLGDGQVADQLDDVVVEKRHPALYRVRHLHAVAQHGQHVAGERRLGPQVQRLIHRRASGELARHVKAVQEAAVGIAPGEFVGEIRREQGAEPGPGRGEGLQPRGYETQGAADARQV